MGSRGTGDDYRIAAGVHPAMIPTAGRRNYANNHGNENSQTCNLY